jgi:hypothetical protein
MLSRLRSPDCRHREDPVDNHALTRRLGAAEHRAGGFASVLNRVFGAAARGVVAGEGLGVLAAAVITGAACGYLHFCGGSRLAMSVDE